MHFIAFYLPQFHPIPENDAVYGKGFTEWNNVRNAKPLFPGHYQPHIPDKTIGWYNLLNEKFLLYQHDMAYSYGVESFCYYYYNFAGHTVLEKPLQIVRNNAQIRNTYCLCWAHPNWYDNRIGPSATFLHQSYSTEHAHALATSLLPYFEDPRYITIANKPLLLIWAPERNPMMPTYAEILRSEAYKHGFKDLYLGGVEAYAGLSPTLINFDCMIEFAPNWRKENHVSAENERPVRIDYLKTIDFMMHKKIPPYLRVRCAFPGWDNTPRRGHDGIACTGSDPKLFKMFLNFLCHYTKTVLPQELQFVFINAWNEWGEGCHIEPDTRYGNAYLRIVHAYAKQK